MLLSDNIERMWDIIESERPDKDEYPYLVRMRNNQGPAVGFRCHTIAEAHQMLNSIMLREQGAGYKVGIA